MADGTIQQLAPLKESYLQPANVYHLRHSNATAPNHQIASALEGRHYVYKEPVRFQIFYNRAEKYVTEKVRWPSRQKVMQPS